MKSAPFRASSSQLGGLAVLACAGLLASPTVAAAAQPGIGGPGGAPGGPVAPPGQGPGQRKEKKDGPAEEAPKDKEALRPIEPVPAAPTRRRRIQLFDLHGYMRIRGDYFHRLNLGLSDANPPATNEERPNKFFRPPAQTGETGLDPNDASLTPNDANCFNRLTTNGVSAQRAATRCQRRNGFASANMRLRLEPTLHVTDTVRVHSQIDVLDNVVLGSTPDALAFDNPHAPLNLYTRTQFPPSGGANSFTDSIVAKRAWGHIRFGWGLDLQFGRMPWSWGMGMVANHGNGYYRGDKADIIRHVDQDFGDNVDSVRLAFDFGKDRRRAHTVAISWDWASSGPTTAQLLGPAWSSGGIVGQDFSAEKFDNVYQWSVSLERRDEPEMLKRKMSLGSAVVNYGIIAWLRYQDVDAAFGSPGFGNALGTNDDYFDNAPFPDPVNGGGDPLGNGDFDENERSGLNNYSAKLVRRRAFLATPDLWLRVNWRTLRVELEMAGTFGSFRLRDLEDDVSALGGTEYFNNLENGSSGQSLARQIVANFGYALEFKYGFFRDRFHIGFDQGMAMGDSANSLAFNPQNPIPENNTDEVISNFRFNPGFNIDLLLFREIMGTVANAAYFKPWAAFYFFDHFSVRADVEYALAAQRQATLGNKYSYGIELDGAVRYHDAREPIFFQMQYGVMFPLGAFNRILTNGRENARAVQTFQGQLGIRF